MAEADQTNLTVLTVELLSAYVSKNSVPDGDLSGLIQSTHAALKAIDAPAPVEPPADEHVPAVSVRKSLGSRSHILSLIDGKPYQTLKRHLSGHGLTPAEYRERYGLAKDYPMVAPAYSEQRRAIAQRLGLGQRVKSGSSAAAAPGPVDAIAPASAPSPAPTKRPRAAPKKAVAAPASEPVNDAGSAPVTAKPVRAVARQATKASAIEPATAVEPAVKKASPKKGVTKIATKATKAAPAKKAKAAPQPDAMPAPEAIEAKPPKTSRARKTPVPAVAEA